MYSAGKVVFLWGPMDPPLAPTGGKYLGHLGVNFNFFDKARKHEKKVTGCSMPLRLKSTQIGSMIIFFSKNGLI